MQGAEQKEKYKSIFTSEQMKAKLFDKIAEHYYFGNFGTMQKSDMDVLMFSIYIEAILDQSEEDINTYSDYTLSKQLGITQAKVSNLKVKKQLQYPYEKFDWKQSFLRACKNARYESGKIRINLRDRNLYYEIKNQIDESGSYVETTLTQNLLSITPEDFYQLVSSCMMDKKEIDRLTKEINKRYNNEADQKEELEKQTIGKQLNQMFKEGLTDMAVSIFSGFMTTKMSIGMKILMTAFQSIKEHWRD